MSTTGGKMMPFMEIRNSGKGLYFRGLTQRFSLYMLNVIPGGHPSSDGKEIVSSMTLELKI